MEVPEEETKVIKGEVCEENIGWLRGSIIGESSYPMDIDTLAAKLISEWSSITNVRDMGKHKILLTFSSMEDIEGALLSGGNILKNYFDNYRRWSEEEICLTRRVWIECFGIPLYAWSCDNIRKIEECWGEVVCLDRETELASSLSIARFLIDTVHWALIGDWVYLSVDGKGYDVYVKEVGKDVGCLGKNRCVVSRMKCSSVIPSFSGDEDDNPDGEDETGSTVVPLAVGHREEQRVDGGELMANEVLGMNLMHLSQDENYDHVERSCAHPLMSQDKCSPDITCTTIFSEDRRTGDVIAAMQLEPDWPKLDKIITPALIESGSVSIMGHGPSRCNVSECDSLNNFPPGFGLSSAESRDITKVACPNQNGNNVVCSGGFSVSCIENDDSWKMQRNDARKDTRNEDVAEIKEAQETWKVGKIAALVSSNEEEAILAICEARKLVKKGSRKASKRRESREKR